MSSTIELIKEFKEDDIYHAFLSDDFNPQTHASHMAQGVAIAEHLSKLSIGLKKLDKEIENQVGNHYEDLLSQTTGIETLEDVLNAIHGRIHTLQAGVERLRARIVEPYTRIEQHVLVLSRLQETCEILRKIIRHIALSQRLQEQLGSGGKDITKAAISLSELDDIGKSIDLTGLEIYEKEQRFLKQARSDIEKQVTIMMEKGMELQNQTQVGTALQVFYNLGMLVPSVDKILDELVRRLHKNISSALDVKSLTQAVADNKKAAGPGKAIVPTVGQSAQFRANLWSGLEKLMDDIYAVCLKTSHLHKVLAKKKDPTTHVAFLDELNKEKKSDLFTIIWKKITKILEDEFSSVAKGSNLIHQALQVDYPKLIRLYGDLWKKLEGVHNDMKSTNLYDSHNYETFEEEKLSSEIFDPEEALRRSLIPFEKAYISRSLSRLFDSVNLMFSTPGTVPSREEIDTLLKTITSELNVSAVDKCLSETISKNVVKTLQLFCQKCEHLSVTDGEASQVIGPFTSGQILNTKIVNQLFYIRSQVERMASASLSHLSTSVTTNLFTVLPVIDNLMDSIISPLFMSLKACVEAIILTMHKEDFSSFVSESMDKQCSLYMKELERFVNRSSSDYLSQFTPSVIKKSTQDLAIYTLEQFIRHASLLRPVGENGKKRLATDFAEMENVISTLINRPSDLGRPYRMLRAFRPFLFETDSSVANSPSIGEIIPHSTVLHFLFARAPPEMRSPHQTAGWSVSRYSSWLDEHLCERERLLLVQGALEAYVSTVRSKHLPHFDPLYPVMLDLLERGVAFTDSQSK